jgi:hypothetical protein
MEPFEYPDEYGWSVEDEDDDGADDVGGGRTGGSIAEPSNEKGRFSLGASIGTTLLGRG